MDIETLFDVERLRPFPPEVRSHVMIVPSLLERLPEDRRPASIALARGSGGGPRAAPRGA